MFRGLLLFALMSVCVIAHAEPLSFQNALERATQAAPDIAQHNAAVEAAQSRAVAAGRLPDPKLVVGLQNVPVTGDDRWSLSQDFMTMRQIGFMQEVPNGALRHAQSQAANAESARAEAEERISVLTVRTGVALAWLDRYYLEQRLSFFDALDRENRLFAAAVQAQLASTSVEPADVIAPKQEAADIADRRDELTGEIAKSKAALARWVGVAADEPLSGEPPPLHIDAAHLRAHVHRHPELAVWGPMIDTAQAKVRQAEAMRRPDWGVELAYGDRGTEFSDMVSLQFTVGLPLFRGTRQNPRIAAERRELSAVENEREAMLREHAQALDAQLAEFDVITRQLARARETRIPLAQDKVRYQFASYRAGKTNLSGVLEARRELIDQQLRELELQARQVKNAAALYFTYGDGAVSTESAP